MGVAQHLAGHSKDLGGGFIVRRVLPAARQRSVGPFVFFDHFGPVRVEPDSQSDVRPHPHIGLATVSYLFEGAIMHRDSLGHEQLIEPGAINWMSAGRGIVHSERRPAALAGKAYISHGLQLWVALPAHQEDSEPFFSHTPADAIGQCQVDAARVRVLVGEAFGLRSPVPAAAGTVYLDIEFDGAGALDLPALAPQLAAYPVSGDWSLDGEPLGQHAMAVLEPGQAVRLQAVGPARLVVIGGEPLDGPRFMWWNFVSSRKERIVQAADEWDAQRMGAIAGETEFIPLPQRHFNF